jgi:hypothetical protein
MSTGGVAECKQEKGHIYVELGPLLSSFQALFDRAALGKRHLDHLPLYRVPDAKSLDSWKVSQ